MNCCHTRITLSSIDYPSSSYPLLDCGQKKYSFGCFENLSGQPPGPFQASVKYFLSSFEMHVLRFPFAFFPFSVEFQYRSILSSPSLSQHYLVFLQQFVKDMLKDLCVYNNKGSNQGSYELKPEYKKSNEEPSPE